MTKFPSLKCPVCGKKYKEVAAFGSHMRLEHEGTIPEGWSDLRYAYFVHTGRSSGRCRECHGDTPWNETTGAYAKICTSDACKKKYRDRFMAGMRARHGKDNLMDDPRYRERMLTGRKISGTYTFSDGGEVAYMAKLEKAFLEMLDTFFRFPSADIMSPSPNRYIYSYSNVNDPEHEGEHVYVPDFYIPSCNLEIELKSSKNERPRNLMVDVPKDACKDIRMIKDPTVNFCKIYEDDYYVFFQIFADLAMQNQTGEKRPIKYISRALLTSIYRDYIPDDLLAVIDKYIYKYSSKAVMKTPATESDIPDMIEDDPDVDEDGADDEPEFSIEDVYEDPDAILREENGDMSEPQTSADVGVNPLLYYANAVSDFDKREASMESFEFFEMDYFQEPALESGFDIDTSTIEGRAALAHRKWYDRLFANNLVDNAAAKNFTKVTIKNGKIEIRGINCNLLLYRIREKYGEKKLRHIFQYHYNARSWNLYKKRRISRGDMKIDYVFAPEFFCLELCELFTELGAAYNDASYKRIAQLIYENSWMFKADRINMPKMSTNPLSAIRLELLPHQVKFIEEWPVLKSRLNLNGYILSFKPGKGKTLTSVGLAECLHSEKVYIVCPNNLKDNWALELRKYYARYDDENIWRNEVCVLGTKFGNPATAKWIITNNENIKLMLAVAKKDPNSMLIVDECHNFRNFAGGRSKELFELADKIASENVLCVSATPIKATPSEITPMLRIIDRTFTDEAAEMYTKCFNLSDTMAMSLVSKRFGLIIYRPADVVVSLPPKNLHPLELSLPNEDRYYMSNVHDEIIANFKERHETWLKGKGMLFIDSFRNAVLQYSLASKSETNQYLEWVIYSSNSLRTNPEGNDDFHELDIKDFKVFIETYIRPNPKCPMAEAERITAMQNELITAAKRHMGYAIGSILPPRRSEMYINLYAKNTETFYEMIRNRTKKTVIFSTMVPVIKHITKDLNEFGIGAVSITGETKDRLSVLTQFREDPNTLVLVATSWCMGVGVTLTEASQMFFFGTPWRSTDFEQACDRIWRIGQTDEVDIYTVKCMSQQKNLSDRMQDILDWSNRMFDTAISPSELGENPDDLSQVVTESYDDQSDIEFMAECMDAFMPFVTFLNENYDMSKEPTTAMEAAGYSPTTKCPVFILLTVGSTALAKIIRGATGDQFSHSSISFDISLDPLYSFGTKKINPKRELGFVKTSPTDKETWGDVATPYSLFVTYVSEADKQKMLNRLNFFLENAAKMQYSFDGLIRVFLHMKSQKKMKWFCSAFVAEILGAGKALYQDSTLFRPDTLLDVDNVEFVIAGDDISKYDVKNAKRALEKVKALEPIHPMNNGSAATETLGTGWKNFDTTIRVMQKILTKFQYGMLVDGKIQDPDDEYYAEHYRTVSPGIFTKNRCGTCYDFVAYQAFFLKAHGIFCSDYYIEFDNGEGPTHTFNIIEYRNHFIYPETAMGPMAGIWMADTVDEIVSCILNVTAMMNKRWPCKKGEYKVYRMKSNYSRFNESLQEYTDRVHTTGTELRIAYNPNINQLTPYSAPEGVLETSLNLHIDSHQYEMLDDAGMLTLEKIRNCTDLLIEKLWPTYSHVPLKGPIVERNRESNIVPNPFWGTYIVYHALQEENVDSVVLLIRLTDKRNPEHERIDKLCLAIPFSDGAIIPEFGMSHMYNDLYFASSINAAVSSEAYYLGRSRYGADFRFETDYFEVDAWVVRPETLDMIPTATYEEFFEEVTKTDKLAIVGLDHYQRELHKVEVFKHGWCFHRY